MFVIRSAFWLLAAYMVIGSASVSSSTPERLVDDGRSYLSEGIASVPCASFECAAGRAALLGALAPRDEPARTEEVARATEVPHQPAPVPPPRPGWAG